MDSSSISVDESEGDVIFSVSGRGNSNGYNSCAGTRAVYLEREDSILAVVNDDEIMEFSLSGKGYGTKITAAHPIFALLKYKDGVVAIEKDGEGYYYEYFSWKKATSVEITGDAKSMKVGDSAKLTAKTNGELDEELTWESENPQIASVTGDGEVYAWKKGTVKITASTKGGATAAYEVKVTVDSDVKDPKNEAVKTSGQKTYNVSDNNYFWYWSATINSYLMQNSDNTLSRIEYIDSEEGVLIETYTADGSKLKSSQKVKAELPIFGGFYSGKDYNYLAFGQENPNESDDREVVRIVKYSKDWKKISSTSIKGANTYIPFDAGTLRMTETDGKLYVYTCHEMYSEGDGVHHQANMIFVINESDMTVVDSHYDVMNISVGYVSHSFNQFIKTDGKSIFRVDHGDAYPRAISIIKSDVDGAITDVDYSLPLEISGNIGYNFTGTTVGGFELSANECIIVGSSVDHESENVDLYGTKNIFVSITDKDFSKDKLIWLTAYKESSNIQVGNPQLVKINDGQFFVMWEETNEETNSLTTKMLTIDTNGNKTSRVISKSMSLSDCQPILCSDGLIRWYATNDSSPTIYAVNPYNLDSAMLGDVNGDGAVDAKDRMTITRHIAKWKGYESIDKTAADVNSDGAIDAKDRMVITRHIAKWKGYEALPYTG